jgi:hypothetical protein
MTKPKDGALAVLPLAVLPRVALLLALLLAAVSLGACDRGGPAPGDTVLAEPKPTPDKPAEPLATATAICQEQTRAKGIKSVAAIFSRLRPGQADKEFADCMRGRGYEVEQ